MHLIHDREFISPFQMVMKDTTSFSAPILHSQMHFSSCAGDLHRLSSQYFATIARAAKPPGNLPEFNKISVS